MLQRFLPPLATLRLAAISVGVAWLVSLLLTFSQPWQSVETHVFDWLSVATAPRKSVLPITIVGIDEESLSRMGKPWPWPRDVHARLIERLVQEKAAVIAIDLPLSEAAPAAEDEALAAAIQAAGNVVLAATHSFSETAQLRQWRRVDPSPALLAGKPAVGATTLVLDDDGTARLFPDDEESFWRQAVRTLVRTRPGSVPAPEIPHRAQVRYLGPPGTFPYVPYHLVLSGDVSIPKGFFTDQVVLIGRDVRAPLAGGAHRTEAHPSPFLAGSRLLTPDVEVQATLIENALMGQAIIPAATRLNLGLLTLVLLLAGAALAWWHPVRSPVLVVLIGVGVAALVWYLFGRRQVWVAGAAPLTALVLALGIMGISAWRTQHRQLVVLRDAFRPYVGAGAMATIVANPGQVRLDGERRELTVLFCDLANFMQLCAKLSPQAVVSLLRLYTTEMTRVVLAHGGTVDRFVGDSVMAFWGAPLDDPRQADNALRAAIGMIEAMERLQPRFSALGVGRLEARVGIHRGEAVVGNLGSEQRFEYTALGDAVNTASRVEAANRIYGTRLLVSGDAAAHLQEAVDLRHIDRVSLRGREGTLDLLTPCDNARQIQASDWAWRAWSRQDWKAAAAAWAELRAIDSFDPVPDLFEARLRRLQELPPLPGWDGSSALDAG